VDSTSIIHSNVVFLGSKVIEPFVILGHPLADNSSPTLTIDNNALIRSHSVLYAGSKIGTNFTTGHGILLREHNTIGNNVSIGTHSIVEHDVILEDNVRIHSNAFIPEFSKVGHHAWIGPHVVFVNDPHPPCAKCLKGPEIEPYAKIGANATLMDHVKIGKNSIVAAGSVVVDDVPPESIVAGNPAKIIKTIKDIHCTADYSEKEKKQILDAYLKTNFKMV
jgi:acetyltransferase-like isoleucine patch superfamily enzyme